MSGAYGHINHLYENGDLRFSDLKKIFIAASEGKLVGTEKTDGINIYLSYNTNDGEVRAARNQTQLKGGGLSVAQIYDFFSEKEEAARSKGGEYNPNIKEAIKDAIENFEKSIMYLDLENQTKIFGDFSTIANFFNCEILDNRTPNVINYETKLLVVHRKGHKSVDLRSGEVFELSDNIENQFITRLEKLQDDNRTEKFPVQVNSIRHLESLSSNEILNNCINHINKILKIYNLTDDNTINEFLVVRLSRMLNNYEIPALNKKLIIKKILGVGGLNSTDILKGLPTETKIEIRNLIKNQRKILKNMISPIENIVYTFSKEILKGLHSIYNLDQNKSNDILRKKLSGVLQNLNTSDSASMQNIRRYLSDINPKKVSLPLEGFVFDYNGKTYKLTGDFAPINQLLNFTNKTVNVNKNNKFSDIAIFPGSFKPPHAGHLNAIKELANLASKVIVVISDPKKDINKRFISENDENMTEIPAMVSKQIFDEYLKTCNLDSRVETVIANNPIKKTKEIITSDPTNSKMFIVSSGPEDKQKYAITYLSRINKNVKPHFLKCKKNMHATNFRNDLAFRNMGKILKYLPDEMKDKKSFADDILQAIFENNQPIDLKESVIYDLISEIVVKRKNKYCLLSKATRRNLGCYTSKAGVNKREKQVQYFKHMKEMSAAGAGAVAFANKPLEIQEEK
jgi:cytidyltransferase-like protein